MCPDIQIWENNPSLSKAKLWSKECRIANYRQGLQVYGKMTNFFYHGLECLTDGSPFSILCSNVSSIQYKICYRAYRIYDMLEQLCGNVSLLNVRPFILFYIHLAQHYLRRNRSIKLCLLNNFFHFIRRSAKFIEQKKMSLFNRVRTIVQPSQA